MITLYTWSHCSGYWEYCCQLKTIEDCKEFIKDEGYNPFYCKFEGSALHVDCVQCGVQFESADQGGGNPSESYCQNCHNENMEANS